MKKSFYQSLASLILFSSSMLSATAADIDYNVNDNKSIVFTTMVENLPLNAAEIHRVATEYLAEAYKDTRYEITECNNDKYIVIGKGKFNGFYQHDGLVSSELYSISFNVRIDAKDNRARVQFIAHTYDVKQLNDLGNKTSTDLVISQCSPINKAVDNKHHRKAFEALSKKAQLILTTIHDELMKATPSAGDDSDW